MARSIIRRASCGLVANSTSSGIPRGLAAGLATCPGPRQVKLAVDQRMTGRGRIAQVDSDLGVLDPPGRAGVLPLHPGRGGAFPQVTGLISDQHRVSQLHQLLPGLIPGGAKKDLSAAQAKALLARVRPRDVAGKARRRVAAELISDLERIYQRKKEADKELNALLAPPAPP